MFTVNVQLSFFETRAVRAASTARAQLPTKPVLPLSVAKRIAAAAEKEAMKRGATVVIAVVDDGGHLIALERLEDTQVASVDVAIGKARTAAIFRRPSKDFEDQIKAIGVSGNTPQEDEDIAKAGAASTAAAMQASR